MCGVSRSPNCYLPPGTLVWRRHVHSPYPSHHAIRTTCTQLLPLVEMYCKWDLQEDCSRLCDLMLRFDSEVELESHALGRSLLSMVRDDDGGFVTLPQPVTFIPTVSPFDAVRHRLDAAALAIRGLGLQVSVPPALFSLCDLLLQHELRLRFSASGIPFTMLFNFRLPCDSNLRDFMSYALQNPTSDCVRHWFSHFVQHRIEFQNHVSQIAFTVTALCLCI